MEQGSAKGKEEEKREIARKMLEMGLELSVSARVTGLSEREIQEL